MDIVSRNIKYMAMFVGTDISDETAGISLNFCFLAYDVTSPAQCARRPKLPKDRSLRRPVGDAHCVRKQGYKVV